MWISKNSDREWGGKDSKPGRKRFRESAEVLCQVIHDWNEEQYWVVPCDGLFLKGGFGGEKKSSLEAALWGDGETHPPLALWKKEVSPVKVTAGEAETSG